MPDRARKREGGSSGMDFQRELQSGVLYRRSCTTATNGAWHHQPHCDKLCQPDLLQPQERNVDAPQSLETPTITQVSRSNHKTATPPSLRTSTSNYTSSLVTTLQDWAVQITGLGCEFPVAPSGRTTSTLVLQILE